MTRNRSRKRDPFADLALERHAARLVYRDVLRRDWRALVSEALTDPAYRPEWRARLVSVLHGVDGAKEYIYAVRS